MLIAVSDSMSDKDLRAEIRERTASIGRKILRKRWKNACAGFDEYDSRATRVDSTKVFRQRALCQFGNGSCQLDSGGSAADDHKIQEPAPHVLVAGDRSLVSTVAHELAHSWSGNLVTNASWSDFWLNEGFTTYFERRMRGPYFKAPARCM